MRNELGKDTFKLGFGLMRLPKCDDGSIDIEQTKQMVDRFIEDGGTYFDTAYVYDNGDSELAARAALVERYPRESYTIATKLNAWLRCSGEEDAKQQLFTSLERLGCGYIDYYLLHALQKNNIHLYDQYHLWDFIKEQKEKGLIRHIGFSFHSDAEMLDRLLTEHPEVEFVQLQINYADWESEEVQSKACYEVARKHGKPVTVMEPVKGGRLADPVPGVKDIFNRARKGASYASWAIRYVASKEGIITVLSGMSSLQQMEDNLSYMKDFQPLTPEEDEVIRQVQEELKRDKSIACTACHYCTDGCPMNIPIPEIFDIWNKKHALSKERPASYEEVTQGRGRAGDCVACGQCEGACPQHLPIISLLKECRALEA